MYAITFEGKVWIQNGGYTANAKFVQRENERQILRDRLLVWGAWFAGLTGMGLLIVELLKHFCWNDQIIFLSI